MCARGVPWERIAVQRYGKMDDAHNVHDVCFKKK